MRLSNQGIMFGGPNTDREVNSGQITAGLHIANSLNIIGMSANKRADTRRIDMWAEGGLNVYGNINLSSINNKPFITCISTEFPNDKISVAIGSNLTREGFLLNIEGNTYFSSNISVNNDIYLKGTITNISDRRIKKDFKKIENALEKIEKISGYIYQRIDTGKIESGLIAQEVLEILPEVIHKDNNDLYNIAYGNMMGIIVEAIKELKNLIIEKNAI